MQSTKFRTNYFNRYQKSIRLYFMGLLVKSTGNFYYWKQYNELDKITTVTA